MDELLDDALYDPDPVVRDGARSKLVAAPTAEQLEQLVGLLDGRRRKTRRRVARVLSEVRPEAAHPVLVATLLDTERPTRVRSAAARLISVLAAEVEPVLAQGLLDIDPRVRRACATPSAPPEALIEALADSEVEVVDRVADALAWLNLDAPAERVVAAVERHPDSAKLRRLLARVDPSAPALAKAAAEGEPTALDHLGGPPLRALLEGEHRVAAAWGLARGDEADPSWASDPDPNIRAAAARALPADSSALEALAKDADPGVAWLARRNLAAAYTPDVLEARLGRHELLERPSAKPPYGLRADDVMPEIERVPAALALFHTRFDVNLGVSVRSSEAAGLSEVILVGHQPMFRSPARGTELVVPVRHVPDAAALLRDLREKGYQLVAVQQTPDSVPFHTADYPPRPLFVLGAEDEGLPPLLRRAADLVVEVPMFGVIDSLNVAACATTVMMTWRAMRG